MMLGAANAAQISTASSQTFSDVPTSYWASGYIEYCASQDIIAGGGDGKFNPEGVLTTIAFSKMLLVALGYNAAIEGYVGSNWAVNIASDALSAGITDSRIAISTTAVCTREQAAQLAFKALTAKTVQYSGGSTITIGETTITTGATREYVANSAVTETITDDNFMQFAENYFAGLTKEVVAVDDFGRPGTVNWKNGATVIATILPVATKTYTAGVTTGKIFTDLGLTANMASTMYIDGKANTSAPAIDYNSTTAIGGAGAMTEVYYDAIAGTIKIVVINTYFGSITAVTAATAIAPATVTVDNGLVLPDADFTTGTFATTGFAVNAKVLYTSAETVENTFVIKSVTAPTKMTLTATSYVANTSFVAGGASYTYSAKLDSAALAAFTAKDVYLDSYGYVINVAGAAATPSNYAVVIAAGTSVDGFGANTYNIKLVKTDGTQVIATAAADAAGLVGSIVTYTISATTGVYTLVDPVTTDYVDVAAPAATLAIALTHGVSAFTWTTDVNPAPGVTTTFYGNASTLYLVRTGTAPYTYTAYTGFANVPSMTGAAVGQVVVTDGFASVVYITAATVSGTTSTNTIYLTGASTEINDAVKGTYYVSNAVVNGAVTTVDLGVAPVAGLYNGVTYNANGVGTIGTGATVFTDTGIVAAAGDVIGFNAAAPYEYYSYTADCAVFKITAAGVVSVSSIAAIATDTNDTVIYTKNASGVVTAIYIQAV
jgi:hypothetical protein